MVIIGDVPSTILVESHEIEAMERTTLIMMTVRRRHVSWRSISLSLVGGGTTTSLGDLPASRRGSKKGPRWRLDIEDGPSSTPDGFHVTGVTGPSTYHTTTASRKLG